VLPTLAVLVISLLAAASVLGHGPAFVSGPCVRGAVVEVQQQLETRPEALVAGVAVGLAAAQPVHATMLYDEILPYAGSVTFAILWGLVLGFVLLRLQEAVPE
ncbi:unnamed protein product, partial [Polarella glacialis]